MYQDQSPRTPFRAHLPGFTLRPGDNFRMAENNRPISLAESTPEATTYVSFFFRSKLTYSAVDRSLGIIATVILRMTCLRALWMR